VTSAYTKGLHELGDGLWAYLQPRGQWGYGNAGLVAAESDSERIVVTVETIYRDPDPSRPVADPLVMFRGMGNCLKHRIRRVHQPESHDRPG
jgi:hypothetical protein